MDHVLYVFLLLFFREQRKNKELDIITGFQVRLLVSYDTFVLERNSFTQIDLDVLITRLILLRKYLSVWNFFELFVLFIQQVLDGQYHMFVLEGLAEKGIRRLWEKLPRPQEEGKILRS